MYKINIIEKENTLLKQIIITNNIINLEAVIYPNLGASIQKLKINNVTIIDGISADEIGIKNYKSTFKSALLFPFPNRIENGKYSFENEEYHLSCNEKAFNNAIHGHVFNKTFIIHTIAENEKSASIFLSYNYDGSDIGFPFPYQLKITYTFSENNLTLNFNVLNTGKKTFPFGIGWHPYFKSNTIANSILNFDGNEQYKFSNNMIPQYKIPLEFSTPKRINKLKLDDCFVTKTPKISLETSLYNLNIHFDQTSEQNYLQIYTPKDKKSIAIEPMTCAPNVYNLKDGMLELKPNKNFNWNINLDYKLKIEF
jgi:aldose 1-epimerase